MDFPRKIWLMSLYSRLWHPISLWMDVKSSWRISKSMTRSERYFPQVCNKWNFRENCHGLLPNPSWPGNGLSYFSCWMALFISLCWRRGDELMIIAGWFWRKIGEIWTNLSPVICIWLFEKKVKYLVPSQCCSACAEV